MVLKRIGVWSAAKLSGVVYGVTGLLVGGIFALMSLVGANFIPPEYAHEAPPAWLGPMLGVGAVIIMPLFYGVLGFICGAIGAALFNFFARLVGGLELELE
jgi:hypothetical protein